MSMRRKLGAGAVLAATPVLALAAPAAADAEGNGRSAETQTFTVNGQEITCTFVGGVQYRWDEGTDTTWLLASSSVESGTDPACWDPSVVYESTVLLDWTEPGGARKSTQSVEDGPNVSVTLPVAGRPTSVNAVHDFQVACDTGLCVLQLETSAK
jgi:hypothetical protein